MLEILTKVLAAPKRLHCIEHDLLVGLMEFGQRALQSMADSINLYCDTRFTIVLTLPWTDYGPTVICSTDYKNLRRHLIRSNLAELFQLPMDDYHRVTFAVKALKLCCGSNVIIAADCYSLVPEIAAGRKTREQMCTFAMYAVVGLAQLLSARNGGGEVVLWGERVPGTGVLTEESLKHWRMVDCKTREIKLVSDHLER